MILYTEHEGEYFQKLPLMMKRKTLLRILEQAKRQRDLREERNNVREKAYFGDYDHVIIWIGKDFYKVASILFSNGTIWDYKNGLRNKKHNWKKYRSTFVSGIKAIWKRYKTMTLDQIIQTENERQRLEYHNFTGAAK